MSADNGIYIGKFKDGYRVIEAQAIDNCFYDNDGKDLKLALAYTVVYFGKAKVFNNLDDARKIAFVMYEEIMNTDFPILEYGISELDFDFNLFDEFENIKEAGKYIENSFKY